jgi:hypothetical protein
MHGKTLGSLGVLAFALACSDSPTAPPPEEFEVPQIPAGLLPADPNMTFGFGRLISAAGIGVMDITAIAPTLGDASFVFLAWRFGNGPALGGFKMSRQTPTGLVEFEGRVTCLTIDQNFPGRARIGGVVTKNNSTAPTSLTENHAVGKDVWFRVQDGKNGAADASTTYGFAPVLVNTSAEYCALPFDGPTWNTAPNSIITLEKGAIDVRP